MLYLFHRGETLREARINYLAYVEAGIEQGRREDLVGGGLIRSLGGVDCAQETTLVEKRAS
jgi:putative transposase